MPLSISFIGSDSALIDAIALLRSSLMNCIALVPGFVSGDRGSDKPLVGRTSSACADVDERFPEVPALQHADECRKMIPDAFPLLVREPNHSTFISDRQQSAILR